MHSWFECAVRYEKTGEDGQIHRVVEPYLVDALSFTEAEKRIIEEIKPFVSGEFTVSKVNRKRIAELIECPSGDKWFRAKVNFVTLDEERAIEKKTALIIMVQGSNIKDALDLLLLGLSDSCGWEVVNIAETAIMDVYPYVASESETHKSPEGDLESEDLMEKVASKPDC